MTTAIYAVMHFFVDFICAWSMFGAMRAGSFVYEYFLIYNFCAFALQMPLGTLLDVARDRACAGLRKRLPLIWTLLGIVFTGTGAVLHPALLGLGNALFHVGGGLDVIVEDFAQDRGGRNLGIFVAPGAVGLYFGTQLGSGGGGLLTLLVAMCILAVLAVLLFTGKSEAAEQGADESHFSGGRNTLVLTLCCFAVVILRSWTGFEASFSWKQGTVLPLLAVLAVALGKALGGFASCRFGAGRTMTVTLILAALCFLLGEEPVFGLAALLLFNMSMPVTLYLLTKKMPRTPGFAFGLLTFGLFLGFLPVYAKVTLPLTPGVAGALGSVISALLMAVAWKAVKKHTVLT